MKRLMYGLAVVVALSGAWWVGRSGYTPTEVASAAAAQQAATPTLHPQPAAIKAHI
jgi:hypothetical protein